MATEAEGAVPARRSPLASVALATGAIGVLIAVLAPTISAKLEGVPLGAGFTLSTDKVVDTPSFAWLWLTHTILGAIALALALAAYLGGGFTRTVRAALALGIAAIAWKFVIYALTIALAVAFLLSFLS
jgi:hypothetical protein